MAYTYIVGWSNLDRWYYGARKNHKGLPESDLWVQYFTSSKIVKKFRAENGEPDVIRVHKNFESYKDARCFEARFLSRVKAAQGVRWLNAHNPNEKFRPPSEFTEKTKKKIGDASRKRWQDPVWREEILKKLRSHVVSEEQRERSRVLMKKLRSERRAQDEPFLKENRNEEFEKRRIEGIENFWTTEAGDKLRAKVSREHKGKSVSAETRERLKEARKKPRAILTCPHCQKQSRSGVMKRWHFDNCPKK